MRPLHWLLVTGLAGTTLLGIAPRASADPGDHHGEHHDHDRDHDRDRGHDHDRGHDRDWARDDRPHDAPPPRREEHFGVRPGYVWQPGRWQWHHGWQWESGRWEHERHG